MLVTLFMISQVIELLTATFASPGARVKWPATLELVIVGDCNDD